MSDLYAFHVLSPLRLGGKHYPVGARIDLIDEAAADLVDAGLIAPTDVTAPAPVVEELTPPTDPEVRIRLIAEAIETLEAGPANFTNSGAPRVEALEAELGFAITGTERDAAIDMVVALGDADVAE